MELEGEQNHLTLLTTQANFGLSQADARFATDQLIAQKKKEKKKKKRRDTHQSNGEVVEEDPVEPEDMNGGCPNGSVKDKKKEKKNKKGEVNGEFSEAFMNKAGDQSEMNHLNGVNTVKKEKRKSDAEGELVYSELGFHENGSSQHYKKSKHEAKEEKKKKKTDPAGYECPSKILAVENHTEKKRKSEDVVNKNIRDDGHLQVKVFGMGAQDDKFRPLQSFAEIQVPENVLDCCKSFEKPSPIQAHAWPFLLDGRDFIGIAATGSGKTLAFGLPALVHVLKKSKKTSKKNHPMCLVLSPTRELAQQISEVLVEAGRPCGVRAACLYGGTSKKPQIAALKTGVEIIVATPGRLQDLVEEGYCSLQEVSYVVLDEADRMLDLGFEHAVRALIGQTLKNRQMLMFSATWPSEVHELSKEFMRESPIKVIVGSQDLAANHAVTQVVEVIDTTSRDARLFELLKEYHKSERNRILVFVLYKKEAVRVENMLQRRGWKASAVHGDKGQFDRNKAVTSFKDGTCPLLIATDVAARGLDIPDVEYVINYSFPLTTEDYVHRIGRTGRAGKSGIAHTFFTQADKARSGELINVLKEAGQTVPLELLKFGTSVKKKESKLYGAHFKEVAVDAPKATKITFDSDEE